MTLPSLQLNEPLVTAMVALLEAQMPSVVNQMNASVTDNITVDPPVQYLPYMPFAGTLEAGLPLIGVQDMPANFVDDLQSNMDAEHQYVVNVVVQNADHETLVWQLRRLLQCVAYTIQQDRLAGAPAGTASVLKTQGGAWSVNFRSIEPGPLLGDIDPENPGSPPRSYLSWTGLVLSSMRREV